MGVPMVDFGGEMTIINQQLSINNYQLTIRRCAVVSVLTDDT